MGEARYYVYAHVRPSDNVIFYIGKGCKKRAWSNRDRNQHWQNTVNKHGVQVVLLVDKLTEQQAIHEEAELIAHFKKFGCLVNVLDRGDINPMSNPEVAKKVGQTKKALGQYDGKSIEIFNANYHEKMTKDPEFAQNIRESRKKAAKASWASRNLKSRDKVEKVLDLAKKGMKQYLIALELGISDAAVSRIVNGKSYVSLS